MVTDFWWYLLGNWVCRGGCVMVTVPQNFIVVIYFCKIYFVSIIILDCVIRE